MIFAATTKAGGFGMRRTFNMKSSRAVFMRNSIGFGAPVDVFVAVPPSTVASDRLRGIDSGKSWWAPYSGMCPSRTHLEANHDQLLQVRQTLNYLMISAWLMRIPFIRRAPWRNERSL